MMDIPNNTQERGAITRGIERTLLSRRNREGSRWGRFFFSSNFIGLLVLIILLMHIINTSFGLVVVRNVVEPSTLSERPLEELTESELTQIFIDQNVNMRVIIRDTLSVVPREEFTLRTVEEVLAGRIYPEERAANFINDLTTEEQAQILSDNLSTSDLFDLMVNVVIKPTIDRSWTLTDSLFNRAEIDRVIAERYPDDTLEFKSWINFDFVTSSVSSSATTAGLRTALLGSFWIILVTAPTALIIGVAAAIYLEEYARDNFINRVISINIRTLAGIPSVIYGMLGLAVFAQALSVITGGYLFGQNLPSQSFDQIVIVIQESIGVPRLNAEGRNALIMNIASAQNDNETFALMQNAIGSDLLTSEEYNRLFRVFMDYRIVRWNRLNTFSSPIEDLVIEDLQRAIDVNKLTPEQFDKLKTGLRNYGSFNINGRTVVSAGLTLALLVLPVIIISAQEAIRAVPNSIREASYGVGATKWQTIVRQVLPSALPGILTGVILSISRAIGETAPLLVVGASTFIGIDPNGFFSKFTVVPIQIYQWTSRPELEFKNVAAAAIIVLLIVMLLLNGTAIFIRNRFSRRF